LPDGARAAGEAGIDYRNYRNVRALILDIDGVLLDARPSYHAVAEEAARRAVAEVLGEAAARSVPFERAAEVPAFKAAGGFNDDWEMSRAIALLLFLRARGAAPDLPQLLRSAGGRGVEGLYQAHGGALTPAEREALSAQHIAHDCGALYGGQSHCKALFGFDPPAWAPERGYWQREVPLAEPATLAQVAARFPLALFTGRNPGEAGLALVRTSLEIPPARRWVADGRPRKPDPEGLLALCKDLLSGLAPLSGDDLLSGARDPDRSSEQRSAALFLGDTADDQAAAAAAQARGAPLLYAHVERAGDTERALLALLRDTGEPAA
jgi:HAD superfamily phosphatase